MKIKWFVEKKGTDILLNGPCRKTETQRQRWAGGGCCNLPEISTMDRAIGQVSSPWRSVRCCFSVSITMCIDRDIFNPQTWNHETSHLRYTCYIIMIWATKKCNKSTFYGEHVLILNQKIRRCFPLEEYFTLRPLQGCKWMFAGVVTPDPDCPPLFPEPDAAPVDYSHSNLNKVILH